jgi:hypothetical protein
MAYAFWVCQWVLGTLPHIFFYEALSQDMTHIDDLLLLGDAHVTLGILSSCVAHQPSYLK